MSNENGKELWKSPLMKMVTENGVELKDAMKVLNMSGEYRPNQAELEKALRGECSTWKIYEVETRYEGRTLVRLIGRYEGNRWFRRGQFVSGIWYDEAEAEIEVDTNLVSWKKVFSDSETDDKVSMLNRFRGTLPRAAMARASA